MIHHLVKLTLHQYKILAGYTIVILIVLGLAPRIIALVVTVVHPILSQCFQKSNDRAILATVLICETLNATSADFVGSGAIAQQAWQTNLQPITCLDDDEVGHDLNSDFFPAPPTQS
jgi:hypothetical protein